FHSGVVLNSTYSPDSEANTVGPVVFETGYALVYKDSDDACNLDAAKVGEADLAACDHVLTVSHYLDIEEVSPSISVDKVATDLGNGSESDPARYTRGDKVQWDYTIENTGNILVHTIDLVDDQGVEVTFPETFEGALAPGESVTATGSATIEDASYTNVADVVAYTECQAPVAPSSIGGGVSLMSAVADGPTYVPNPGDGELWPVPLCLFDDQGIRVDKGYKVSASDAWYGVIAPGTLVVNHVDEQGNELAPSTSDEGDVGSDYTTAPADIDGYELIAVPENAEGEYIEGEIVVTYVYAPIVEPTPDPEDPTPAPEPEDPAPTPEPEDPNGEDPSDPEAEELPELEETGVSVGALIAGALTLITAGAGAVTIRRNRLSN
ncbi:MAG TPA: MucBP domain-containing protein, partial [Beutenbergiaceae bacterium]|nr:MucBP domain-containing protein [Beutenbergiaceae bacterium]